MRTLLSCILCVYVITLSGKSHIFSRLSHCIFSVASLLLPPFYSAASNLNCSKYSVRATHHNKTQLEQQIHIATTLHVFIYPPLDGWMDGWLNMAGGCIKRAPNMSMQPEPLVHLTKRDAKDGSMINDSKWFNGSVGEAARCEKRSLLLLNRGNTNITIEPDAPKDTFDNNILFICKFYFITHCICMEKLEIK